MSDETDSLKRQRIQDMYPDTELIFFDRIDDAMVGVVTQFGAEPKVCYDYHRCIAILMGKGMTHEEALDWFHYNTIGSYVGPCTPVFLEKEGTEWMNY